MRVLAGLAWGYTPYCFASLGLVIPVALMLQRRGLGMAAVLGALVFLALYGELWLPQWRGTDHDGQTLKVMTYNILGSNRDWPAVSRSILDSQADVVSLQELNREEDRGGKQPND
ncbi:MAG TPA: hypothetical protein ENN19_02300 [Chloroflexi bacterium]|nr:hypothetical protein [Chloroflexota bacterium]